MPTQTPATSPSFSTGSPARSSEPALAATRQPPGSGLRSTISDMAQVLVTPAAREDLERMIRTHSLPADTVARVAGSLRELESFPLLGPALEGRWDGFRFVL